MVNIYERLRARLDDPVTGYSATESKIEIRLPQRLFTGQEAQLLLHLSPLLQKLENQRYESPKTGAETYIRIMQERGKI
jgi:hypothetical protein